MTQKSAKQDANLKGRVVTTRVEFVGIPLGTRGTVVRVEALLSGAFLVVQWDLPWDSTSGRNVWPYKDWFSKDQYNEFLVETGETVNIGNEQESMDIRFFECPFETT